jgi:hypothetical protein
VKRRRRRRRNIITGMGGQSIPAHAENCTGLHEGNFSSGCHNVPLG